MSLKIKPGVSEGLLERSRCPEFGRVPSGLGGVKVFEIVALYVSGDWVLRILSFGNVGLLSYLLRDPHGGDGMERKPTILVRFCNTRERERSSRFLIEVVEHSEFPDFSVHCTEVQFSYTRCRSEPKAPHP